MPTTWVSGRILRIAVGVALAAALIYGLAFGRHTLHQRSAGALAGSLFIFALLCSVVSYSSVELLKRFTGARAQVQRDALISWWTFHATSVSVDPLSAWRELLVSLNESGLARPEARWSRTELFGLSTRQLSAQLTHAVDSALETPRLSPALSATMVRSPEDITTVRYLWPRISSRRYDDPPFGSEDDELRILSDQTLSAMRDFLEHPWNYDEDDPRTDLHDVDRLRQALERLRPRFNRNSDDDRDFAVVESQRVRANLDRMYITMSTSWRWVVEGTSVLFAGLTGLLIELAQPSAGRPLYIAAAALVGGPLAWTIRDLTAVVERWRR